jgi:hypothetical protein
MATPVNWQRRLPRTIGYTKPTRGTIVTLHAREYMLAIDGGREKREYWQRAAELLMAAADRGDLDALALQIEMALMMDGALAF